MSETKPTLTPAEQVEMVTKAIRENVESFLGQAPKNIEATCQELSTLLDSQLKALANSLRITDPLPIADAGGYRRLGIKSDALGAVVDRLHEIEVAEVKPTDWLVEVEALEVERSMLEYELNECRYFIRKNKGSDVSILYMEPDGRLVNFVEWLKEHVK